MPFRVSAPPHKRYTSRGGARLRSLGVLICLALLCTIAQPAGLQHARARSAPALSDRPRTSLTPAERGEILDEVWQTVYERYYDPAFKGVDWRAVKEKYRKPVQEAANDDAFYTVVKQMLGELHDAHTRFHTPRERRERELQLTVSVGLIVSEVEGQPVVSSVEPDSEAARAGVKPGMIVRTVDGKPIADKLAEAKANVAASSSEQATRLRVYRRLVAGNPGTVLKLGLEPADGTRLDVSLTRVTASDAASVQYRKLASGAGYIRLSLWKEPAHSRFKTALDNLRDTKGLVIDLRENPGGEDEEVLKIAGNFFKTRVQFGKFSGRSGRSTFLFTHKSEHAYAGPVAILVNDASGSGSEMFAGAMQEGGRATIVGTQTCACLLGITKFRKMKGGGELAVSELGYVTPRGRVIEGRGVVPDVVAPLTISDLRSGRDAAVEEAEKALKDRRIGSGKQIGRRYCDLRAPGAFPRLTRFAISR
jgi:carboxyl-terminal processing protease